jgi:hypothetical protein
MGISSAAYGSLSPTDLDNFTNPLRLPGEDGLMGILDGEHRGPARQEERDFGLPRRAGRQVLSEPDHQDQDRS